MSDELAQVGEFDRVKKNWILEHLGEHIVQQSCIGCRLQLVLYKRAHVAIVSDVCSYGLFVSSSSRAAYTCERKQA